MPKLAEDNFADMAKARLQSCMMIAKTALRGFFRHLGSSHPSPKWFVGMLSEIDNICKIFPPPPFDFKTPPLFCLTSRGFRCIL